jgi:diguanylate cyclase (GGDEF)-like protein
MIELRKAVIFLFVTVLMFYMIRLLYLTGKKCKRKNYIFILLISGVLMIDIATFLDMCSSIFNRPVVYSSIKIFFTVGAIIYIIGIGLWSNFTREIINNLEKLTLTDCMTGVLNRSGIEKIFNSLVKDKSSFYIIVCDLDGTKLINDTYGHVEGDRFINSTTKIITKEIKENGYLSRIGGDEFVVILECKEIKEVENLIFNIKKEVGEIYPQHNTGISLGYAMFPSDAISFRQLISVADKRMYSDKKNKIRDDINGSRLATRGNTFL